MKRIARFFLWMSIPVIILGGLTITSVVTGLYFEHKNEPVTTMLFWMLILLVVVIFLLRKKISKFLIGG